MKDIFEQATRGKLRFLTNRGRLTVEDLWDLPLDALDEIAIALSKVLDDTAQKSFIKKKITADKGLTLSLDIVKSIIDTKMAEEERRTIATEKKAKRNQLLELIERKETDALSRKSAASLRAELDKLDDDEEEQD